MSGESIAGTRDDRRSAMARASDARPFKPYVWKGDAGTQAADEARRRWRARHEESQPDPAPDPEWYRELAAETGEDLQPLAAGPAARADPGPDPGPEPGPEPEPQTAEPEPAAEMEPEPETVTPSPAATRCRQCGYPAGSVGHKVSCGTQDAPQQAAVNGHTPAKDPHVREVGRLADEQGREVIVGVSYGAVTLRTLPADASRAVELGAAAQEEMAQLLIAAVWQAARQAGDGDD